MKQSRFTGRFLLVLSVAALFALGGCCVKTTKALSDMKDRVTKERVEEADYQWVARQSVSCKQTCDGCNQLHLIKGDACYRLAKAGKDPKTYYALAVKHLDKGIAMTENGQWEDLGLDRARYFTNLCESLLSWRELLSKDEFNEVNDRLIKKAHQFLEAEPGNPCAVHFLVNAGYAKLAPCLSEPDQCPGLCSDLDTLATSVLEGEKEAAESPCRENLRVMTQLIRLAKQRANCQ